MPSREGKDEDDDLYDRREERVSNVTLSGLLNALDSVVNEEGRMAFATVFDSRPTTSKFLTQFSFEKAAWKSRYAIVLRIRSALIILILG